jgi:hypothetical protein
MMESMITWMASTRLAHFMGDWQWAWPWAEAFHFIGMSLLFGSLLIMDLRLMGFFRKYLSIHAVHALTPWALGGFAINLLTGISFFVKDADRYVTNQSFQFKMVVILLAGINFLVFWFKIRTDARTWTDDQNPTMSAKLVGATSLLAWTLVIWGGRMIPVYGPG